MRYLASEYFLHLDEELAKKTGIRPRVTRLKPISTPDTVGLEVVPPSSPEGDRTAWTANGNRWAVRIKTLDLPQMGNLLEASPGIILFERR